MILFRDLKKIKTISRRFFNFFISKKKPSTSKTHYFGDSIWHGLYQAINNSYHFHVNSYCSHDTWLKKVSASFMFCLPRFLNISTLRLFYFLNFLQKHLFLTSGLKFPSFSHQHICPSSDSLLSLIHYYLSIHYLNPLALSLIFLPFPSSPIFLSLISRPSSFPI